MRTAGADPEPFFVGVAGNVGVGKTMVSRALGERLGWTVQYEPVVENPYLDAFYADMARHAFRLQIYFLAARFGAQRRLEERAEPFIQDRTVYEDADVFAKTLAGLGYLDQTDHETYRALFVEMTRELRSPSLIVYLHANVDTLVSRIAARGRSADRRIDRAYLDTLQEAYGAWVSRARDCFDVIEVDTEPPSFLESGIDEIEEIVRRRRGPK